VLFYDTPHCSTAVDRDSGNDIKSSRKARKHKVLIGSRARGLRNTALRVVLTINYKITYKEKRPVGHLQKTNLLIRSISVFVMSYHSNDEGHIWTNSALETPISAWLRSFYSCVNQPWYLALTADWIGRESDPLSEVKLNNYVRLARRLDFFKIFFLIFTKTQRHKHTTAALCYTLIKTMQ